MNCSTLYNKTPHKQEKRTTDIGDNMKELQMLSKRSQVAKFTYCMIPST